MGALGKGEIERSRSDKVSDNSRRETGVEGGGNEKGMELRKIKEEMEEDKLSRCDGEGCRDDGKEGRTREEVRDSTWVEGGRK